MARGGMMNILEELYYGNIRPDSRVYPPNSPFVEAAKLKNKNLEKLMAALNDSEKETFEKYCDAESDIQSITRYDTYTYALKFGILLMIEIFMGKSEVVGEEEIL